VTQRIISKAQETIEFIAVVVATYYDALRRGNVPEDTARCLSRDLHDRYMDAAFPMPEPKEGD
jgi:hypothetical protein